MNTTTKLIRWILFIPISVFAAWLIFYLFNFIELKFLNIISPVLSELVKGLVTWSTSAIALMFVAALLIPQNKKQALKFYGIVWSVLTVGWTIFSYVLAQKEIVGSFWFPLLLNMSFFLGVWLSYWKLISFTEND